MPYDSYEDWYDNGPGSESFKRNMARSRRDYDNSREVVVDPDHGIIFRKIKPKDAYDYQI